MTRPRTLLVVATMLMLSLAACGGSQPAAGPTGTAPPAASTGSPLPPQPPVPPGATATGAATAEPTSNPVAEPTASTGAIPRERLPLVEFLLADGSVVSLPVEAPPRGEYTIGLSGRRSLDERGMLFHYDEPAMRRGFWMKDTHVDLSIAFVGGDLRIVEIREMEAESLDAVRPGAPYQYAIEAPAGWYAAHGVRAGDRVRFTFELPRE